MWNLFFHWLWRANSPDSVHELQLWSQLHTALCSLFIAVFMTQRKHVASSSPTSWPPGYGRWQPKWRRNSDGHTGSELDSGYKQPCVQMVFFGSCNEYTQPYVSPIFGGDGLDMYVIAFARLSADTALHFARLTVKITALYFVYISGSCTEHAHSCISPVCEMHSPTFPPPLSFSQSCIEQEAHSYISSM